GLPREQAALDLLGKALRVRSRAEDLARKKSGSLVVAVTVASAALETRHDHVRAEIPDHANHVAESDIVAMPLLEGFFRALGKAKVNDLAEALLDAVILVRGKQFQG